jgi:GDP-mannose 6-dehydrogenase
MDITMSRSISVFGLGYVGCVSAACLARNGWRVFGVDVSQQKVDQINSGKSTILEEGIAELVSDVVGAGRLTATADAGTAIDETDLSLICVGTPSRSNGSIDLAHIIKVSEEIGSRLKGKKKWHTIVIRSTVMPGTIDTYVIPAIERTSGLVHGTHFGVCSNPEFLREGSSIKDFDNPPFTLIGASDKRIADPLVELYAGLSAPLHIVDVRVAEMLKYACNSFHGLKVGFANEIGSLCRVMGIDSHEVMRLFCEDKKLNISTAYLRPGFAFGGSCLPKDLRAIVHRGRLEDVPLPILESTLESNHRHIERAYRMIQAGGSKRVGILGIAFKAGTDDLRESPMVTLTEMLLGRGFDLQLHDRDVSRANIVGANREYIEREIPHLWGLMREDHLDVIKNSDTIVIGNGSAIYRELDGVLAGKMIIDLARAIPDVKSSGRYQGICW